MQPNDAAVVAQVLAGDREAFGELMQHAAVDPSLPSLACYEFAVLETKRLTKLQETVRDVMGDVPARKLSGALDRLFESLVSLRESTG